MQDQKDAWLRALKQKKKMDVCRPNSAKNQAGMGPNKAAGRKGGIRRQGSKRG